MVVVDVDFVASVAVVLLAATVIVVGVESADFPFSPPFCLISRFTGQKKSYFVLFLINDFRMENLVFVY